MQKVCDISTLFCYSFIYFDMLNVIEQASGEYNIEGYKKTASTVLAIGDVLTTTTGLLVKANATTNREAIVGICQRAVLATDADYAAQSVIPVNVTGENPNEFYMPVLTGSAVQSMVGSEYDLHADGDGLDVTAQLEKVFRITAIISTTLVKGRFISAPL